VDGQARGARRQARGPGLRLAAAAAALAGALAPACAFMGSPPGGPPRTIPPRVVRVVPESGAVLTTPPHQVEIDFDEVIGEQTAATQRDIQGAVLLSPADKWSVDWHRTHLTVEPKGGFKPDRVYRVELLPVIVDLHQNRLRQDKIVVFSTGPEIPAATLRGAVVDWTGGHLAAGALVEAVLLPDSLTYRTLTDSGGNFALGAMPTGDYLVYGVVDLNSDHHRQSREPFDTVRVSLQDSAEVGLYAFAHDTVGPRLRSVELVDSLTLRLIFDRPIDPTQPPDTSMVQVTPAEDTTQRLAIGSVLTPEAWDSVTKAAAAAAAARDTTHRAPAPGRPGAPARPGAAGEPQHAQRQGARRAGGLPAGPRPDTTRATHLLAVRPAPTDRRIVRLAAPLERGSRVFVFVAGMRGLTGVVGHQSRATLTVPKPTKTRADSLRQAAAADSLRRSRGADTTQAAPPDTAHARADTTHAPSDTARARPDSTRPNPDSLPPRGDSTPPAQPPLPARRDSGPALPPPPLPAPSPPR